MISREVWEPCIACGAPVSVGGAGHDEGCPVMVTDAQIAASMALAAMDNRASWDGLDREQQARSRIVRTIRGYSVMRAAFGMSGTPLHVAAAVTAERRTPIWILED